MPHSPFTRFLALAIVAAYALALLWPDPRAQIVGSSLMMALPFLLGLFIWNTVRDAPVFNDHAFHRTLPTDDAQVFRRTLRLQGMVLLGISLVVVVYCLSCGFSWQVMTYGVALLALPVWGFMALCGTAMSAATSNEHGKSWAYITTFVVPVLSVLLLHNLQGVFLPYHEVSPLAMWVIVSAGAVLYPLYWWLVASRRRRTAGLVLCMVTGALMPWTYLYGGFSGVPRDFPEDARSKPVVRITRKAVAPDQGKWIRVEDFLQVEGLREGEYFEIDQITSADAQEIVVCEVPDDPAAAEAGVFSGRWVVGCADGRNVQWGRKAVWESIRKQIPAHDTFGFWTPMRDVPTHLALLKQGESARLLRYNEPLYSKPEIRTQLLMAGGPAKMAMRAVHGDICRMEKVGVVSVESGGTCSLSGGGKIKVNPLRKNSLTVECYIEELSRWDAPWIGKKGEGYSRVAPWVVAVDESGKHAMAMDDSGRRVFAWESGDLRYQRETELLGGRYTKYVLRLRGDTPEEITRMEMLKKCQLHVFVPIVKYRSKQAVVPVE